MQEVNSLCTNSGPLWVNTVLCHSTQYTLLVVFLYLPVTTVRLTRNAVDRFSQNLEKGFEFAKSNRLHFYSSRQNWEICGRFFKTMSTMLVTLNP